MTFGSVLLETDRPGVSTVVAPAFRWHEEYSVAPTGAASVFVRMSYARPPETSGHSIEGEFQSEGHDTPRETLHDPGRSHVAYRHYTSSSSKTLSSSSSKTLSSSSSSVSSTGASNLKTSSSSSSSSCPSSRLSSDVSSGSVSSSTSSTSSNDAGMIAASGSASLREERRRARGCSEVRSSGAMGIV